MRHTSKGVLFDGALRGERTYSTCAWAQELAASLILALILGIPASACSAADRAANAEQRPSIASNTEVKVMKIRLTINGKSTNATLDDNPTARDFLTLLPLTLTLEDYNATEKIAYLPRKLSTQGAPAGIDPEVGDITYYAPWGNVALFYRDFGYSAGLIRLGRFDAGVGNLAVQGSLKLMIEAIRP